jgi:hypothetical protein
MLPYYAFCVTIIFLGVKVLVNLELLVSIIAVADLDTAPTAVLGSALIVKLAPGKTIAVPTIPLNLNQETPSPVSVELTLILTFHVLVIVIAVPAANNVSVAGGVPKVATA